MSASRLVTIVGFVVLALAAVALDVRGRRHPDRGATLGATLTAIARSRSGRLVLVAAWWWLGWHVFSP
jgi:hypothetical protein